MTHRTTSNSKRGRQIASATSRIWVTDLLSMTEAQRAQHKAIQDHNATITAKKLAKVKKDATK